MKKLYFLLLFLFFHNYFCFSQTPEEDDNSKVEVIKMGYMTRELNLTPDEAKSFWPVYNNYVNEIKQARNQYPNDEVAFEKKVVEIKENYKGNFRKVLGNNTQRINKVYTTDKQFNNTLRDELNKRQQNRTQNNQQTEPNQTQQLPKNNADNPNNSNKKNNINKKQNNNKKRANPPL